jgi:Fe-S oxidoreductase
LCCGGSLGNIMLTIDQKDAVRKATLEILMEKNPDVLVTACPLCKKTFNKGNDLPVRDIAELVCDAMQPAEKAARKSISKELTAV